MLVLWFLTNIVGSANRVVVVNTRLLIVGAIFSFLLIAFLLSFLIVRSQNPLDLFGLRERRLAAESSGGLLGAGGRSASDLFYPYAELPPYGRQMPSPNRCSNSWPEIRACQDKLLLILTAVVIAPIAEELIFRGYIFGVLRRYAGRWWAMLISASVFAAIHAHIPSLAGLFVLAVALTLVYEGAGSLWAPILMHALFNGLTVILTLAWPDSMK